MMRSILIRVPDSTQMGDLVKVCIVLGGEVQFCREPEWGSAPEWQVMSISKEDMKDAISSQGEGTFNVTVERKATDEGSSESGTEDGS